MPLDATERSAQSSIRQNVVLQLGPRTKLIATLGLIVTIVGVPIGSWRILCAIGLLLSFLSGLGRLNPIKLFQRWLVLLPPLLFLAGTVAISHPARAEYGLLKVTINLLAKNALAISSVFLLSSTTSPRELLRGLASLPIPVPFIVILQLMYRYVFILVDELSRMARARQSRSFRQSYWNRWPLGAGLIASLLLRSIERGERVHAAMLARGWDGTPEGLSGFATKDVRASGFREQDEKDR